jgi:hypothetical protein
MSDLYRRQQLKPSGDGQRTHRLHHQPDEQQIS